MGMNSNIGLGLLASFLAVTVVSMPAIAQQPQKPNVVFILADNVGYGDLGVYGGGELRGAPTPRLDQLAAEGMRLTNTTTVLLSTPSSLSVSRIWPT